MSNIKATPEQIRKNVGKTRALKKKQQEKPTEWSEPRHDPVDGHRIWTLEIPARPRGFTLMELLIAISIVGGLALSGTIIYYIVVILSRVADKI